MIGINLKLKMNLESVDHTSTDGSTIDIDLEVNKKVIALPRGPGQHVRKKEKEHTSTINNNGDSPAVFNESEADSASTDRRAIANNLEVDKEANSSLESTTTAPKESDEADDTVVTTEAINTSPTLDTNAAVAILTSGRKNSFHLPTQNVPPHASLDLNAESQELEGSILTATIANEYEIKVEKDSITRCYSEGGLACVSYHQKKDAVIGMVEYVSEFHGRRDKDLPQEITLDNIKVGGYQFHENYSVRNTLISKMKFAKFDEDHVYRRISWTIFLVTARIRYRLKGSGPWSEKTYEIEGARGLGLNLFEMDDSTWNSLHPISSEVWASVPVLNYWKLILCAVHLFCLCCYLYECWVQREPDCILYAQCVVHLVWFHAYSRQKTWVKRDDRLYGVPYDTPAAEVFIYDSKLPGREGYLEEERDRIQNPIQKNAHGSFIL